MKEFDDETDYQKHFQIGLEAIGISSQAHEDSISNFIPDVSFSGHGIDGWVEVKYCKKPPKTLGSIKHWTKGQEAWLKEFGAKGNGHCYLLVGVPGWHYLFHYSHLAKARTAPFSTATGQMIAIKDDTIDGLCAKIYSQLSTTTWRK